MNLHQHAIAIAGAGRSGLAAARLALRQGAEVTVLDSGAPEKLAARREALPEVEMVFGEDALAWKGEIATLVVSPGIDLQSPLIAPWVERGTPVMGEIELAYRFWEGAIVAITGTNGKTTTTELTTHILNHQGNSAVAGGNYGKPFAEIVLEHPSHDTIAVLELSSFQLETIDQFRAHTTVWMNLAPDHMDRYASFADYREAKRAIFRNQTASDFAIINAANGPDIELTPQTISFSAFEAGADYHYNRGAVFYRDERLIDLEDTQLSGRHNAENLMAALAVGSLQGLSFEAMRAAVPSYRPPRHRCERVPGSPSLTILNDSKSTNVHALESSLRALDGPLVLIAGGKEKGLDYTGLIPWLGEKVTHLVAIGEIREKLAGLAQDRCPAFAADSLETAVAIALREASSGHTILFSPGTSSFDMFSGYEERGDAFCNLIKQQPTTHHEKEAQTRL